MFDESLRNLISTLIVKYFNLDYTYYALISGGLNSFNFLNKNLIVFMIIIGVLCFLYIKTDVFKRNKNFDILLPSKNNHYYQVLITFLENTKSSAKIFITSSGTYINEGVFIVKDKIGTFSVEGIIVKEVNEIEEGSKKTKKTIIKRYVGIKFLSNFNSSNFMNVINQRNNEFLENKTVLTCSYFITKNTKYNTFYSEKDSSYEDLEKKYIKSFFNQNASKVWKVCKNIILGEKIVNSAGFLLYGPPGTGKSKIAVNIAKALKLNIFIVDLRIKTYEEIFNILTEKNIVIIIDEIDNFFRFIEERDNENLRKKQLQLSLAEKKTENKEIMLEEKSKYLCDFSIEDLLFLLDGPISMENRLIFATTNKFDYLNKNHSNIFRSGRLGPVEISFLNDKYFKKLCMFYYKKTSENIFKGQYSYAEIINFIQTSNNFEEFEKKIFEKENF